MSGAIRHLSEKYLSAAETSAAEGNEVNTRYFLEEALFFAEKADDDKLLIRIESEIFNLLSLVDRADISFCLSRAEAIINGNGTDYGYEGPRTKALSVYNLARDAQRRIVAIRDETEHRQLAERVNRIFAELNKKDLAKYLPGNWRYN